MNEKSIQLLVIGILGVVIGAIVSANMLGPVISALVVARAVTGLDSGAAGLFPVTHILYVILFGFGPAIGGLAAIFSAYKESKK